MAIHHTTAKRATDNGISFRETDDLVFATVGEHTVSHIDPKVALDIALLAKRFGAEHLVQFRNETLDSGETFCWIENLDDPIFGFDPTNFDLEAVFAETLEIANEEGFDIDIEAEEIEIVSQ